ncbi:MAG: aldo/keto reductase, partial [Patescibacteria group bacterium]|nr:aldo/keto reductase [Patescibacteria group bacterium]
VARGLVRAIGVCNFSTASLAEARAKASNPIVYNQVHYNLEFRECEADGLLRYCEDNDVLLAAWRPVQKGLILEDPPKIVYDLAEKYGKSYAQIALNWLVSQRNVVTLSKTRHVGHLEENLGALGWTMDAEDIELLRSGYPDRRFVSDVVPLG